MDPAVLAARVLLSVVLTVAGVAKLRAGAATERAVSDFGVRPSLAAAVARALPALELLIALGLLLDPTARVAGAAAAVLLAVFSTVIVKALREGRAPDCGCFGAASTKPVSRWTVARNAVLLAAAALASLGGQTHLPALVAIAAAAMAAIFAAVGSEAAGLPGVTVDARRFAGLDVGERAPAFSLASVAGGGLSLGDLQARGVPAVLLFLDSGCGSCRELHPHLRRWQRALGDRLSIAVVMTGDSTAAHELAETHGASDVLIDSGDQPLRERFEISSTPSAVVVGPDGAVASGPARGADAIEELVRQTLRRSEEAEPWKRPSPVA